MKVNKYQVGGILPVHTPWQYSNFIGSQETTSNSSSSKSSAGDYEKMMIDVLKDMKGKVLQSEYDVFLKKVSKFIDNPDQGAIVGLLSHANLLLTNKERADKMSAELNENNAGGEIARSGTYIYCKNLETDKVELLSANDIQKRIKKDKPIQVLTYNDLDSLRRNDSSLGYNNNIINDIGEGIGMQKISEFCNSILDKIESDIVEKKGNITKADIRKSISQFNNSGKAPTPEEAESLIQLSKMYSQMSSDGQYKYDIKTESSRKHINAAFKYIYQMMPKNMKEALTVQSQIYGDGKPENLIAEFLHFGTKETEKYDVSLDEKAMENKSRLTPLETFLNGDLNQTNIKITLGNDVVSFKGSVGYLTDYHKNPLETNLLGNVLSNNNMGTLLDTNQIYFGNNKIPFYALNNFIYKGEQAGNTMVPVDSKGNIDFNMFTKLQKAQEQIQQAPNKTPEVIQTIYSKHGIPTIREGNEIEPNLHLEQFIVASGVTTNNIIEDPEQSLFTQLVNNDDLKDGYEMLFKRIYGNTNTILKKQGFSEIDIPTGNPIEGVIFMKVKPEALTMLAANSGHGSVVSNPTLEQNMVRQQINNSRNNSNFIQANLASLQ